MKSIRPSTLIPVTLIVAVVAMVVYANLRDAQRVIPPQAQPIGAARGAATSREGLEGAIKELEARIEKDPADLSAAVVLADALMRQARVHSDAALVIKAEQVLKKAIGYSPEDYASRRMLATVYLAQHRFRDAIQAAEWTSSKRPNDEWNYGVLGDSHIELGDYEAAFAAIDKMSLMRPSAATYGRVAYARELRGDLEGALKNMRMAADATSSRDLESLAWHYSQIGNLLFQLGRTAEAKLEYERALFHFPNHPYALLGLARLRAASGDLEGALADYEGLLERGPNPELAASIGDLQARLGRAAEAERAYQQAEQLERDGWKQEEPQPGALARFLAERGRKIDEAVKLAEEAASQRSDIFTMDALALSYFKAGRLQDARAASERALRTGSRDRRILYHAAAIRHALGDRAGARTLLERALEDQPNFDPLVAPAAATLLEDLTTATQALN